MITKQILITIDPNGGLGLQKQNLSFLECLSWLKLVEAQIVNKLLNPDDKPDIQIVPGNALKDRN